jgi:RNA recognition motif-containing protein
MAHSVAGPTALFLGDLSVYCTERNIFELFQTFGQVESVQIKKSEDGSIPKPHLCYGFVKFHHRACAEMAFKTVNRKIFLGRPIR